MNKDAQMRSLLSGEVIIKTPPFDIFCDALIITFLLPKTKKGGACRLRQTPQIYMFLFRSENVAPGSVVLLIVNMCKIPRPGEAVRSALLSFLGRVINIGRAVKLPLLMPDNIAVGLPNSNLFPSHILTPLF